jgi:SAM-dependent methyltransferase
MDQGVESPVRHYQGEAGRKYFAHQEKGGRHAAWNMHIWERQIGPEDDVIEFGCGGGQLLKEIVARTKLGVEVNPAAIEHASSLGIEVRTSLAEVPSASFSLAISSHALEHVASPFETLKELRRVLRPSGRLVLLLPLDDWRSPIHRKYRSDDIDMHIYTWTPQGLGNLLKTAGFVPREVRVLTHAWPPRGGQLLSRLNPALFHSASFATAFLLRRRQLLAVATVLS